MSGTPKLTRLLPPSAMCRPLKENSTQAPCVRLTILFSRAPKADCPTRAPGAHFFRASRFPGGSFQLGKIESSSQRYQENLQQSELLHCSILASHLENYCWFFVVFKPTIEGTSKYFTKKLLKNRTK